MKETKAALIDCSIGVGNPQWHDGLDWAEFDFGRSRDLDMPSARISMDGGQLYVGAFQSYLIPCGVWFLGPGIIFDIKPATQENWPGHVRLAWYYVKIALKIIGRGMRRK